MTNPDDFESFNWLSEYQDQALTDWNFELPLHMKFRPILNNLYFEEDQNLSEDTKVIFERISLHYLMQIALLTDTLKKLGVGVFYGTDINDPDENPIFFCSLSKEIQEFVDQQDIEII